VCERDLQWKVIRKVLSRTSFSHLVRASPRGKSALPARMRPAGADAAECNVPGFMNGASTSDRGTSGRPTTCPRHIDRTFIKREGKGGTETMRKMQRTETCRGNPANMQEENKKSQLSGQNDINLEHKMRPGVTT
jgi:hypothetical protein